MRVVLSWAALPIIGLVLAGCGAQARSAAPAPARIAAAFEHSPPVLAALHAQADRLLGGGPSAFAARLRSLRGYPVVVNKWASWCVPCRSEFGAFQRASVAQGRQVAFIGLDSGDSSLRDARAFLRSFPVSYPSYYDKSGQAGAAITDSTFTPVTVFYDRSGREFIRQGPYPTSAKLEQDVRRYALDG